MGQIFILFEHRPDETIITGISYKFEALFDTMIKESNKRPQTLIKVIFNIMTGKAEVITLAEMGDLAQWLKLDLNWKIKTHDIKEKSWASKRKFRGRY